MPDMPKHTPSQISKQKGMTKSSDPMISPPVAAPGGGEPQGGAPAGRWPDVDLPMQAVPAKPTKLR